MNGNQYDSELYGESETQTDLASSRRRFIKRAGASVAVLAAAGGMSRAEEVTDTSSMYCVEDPCHNEGKAFGTRLYSIANDVHWSSSQHYRIQINFDPHGVDRCTEGTPQSAGGEIVAKVYYCTWTGTKWQHQEPEVYSTPKLSTNISEANMQATRVGNKVRVAPKSPLTPSSPAVDSVSAYHSIAWGIVVTPTSGETGGENEPKEGYIEVFAEFAREILTKAELTFSPPAIPIGLKLTPTPSEATAATSGKWNWSWQVLQDCPA